MLSKLKKRKAEEREPGLVERHFVLQEERPDHLREVEIEALEPFLRNLLFTDGTVTRAFGAQMLTSVAVEPLGQAPLAMPPGVAALMEAEAGGEAIRRRVRIGVGSPSLTLLWAESFLIPDRLPPGFLGLLDAAPDGIGQSLQRVSLESTRELCWFGIDGVPEWAPEPAAGSGSTEEALCRQYRVISDRKPAILIAEHFAVERHLGMYHLAGLRAHAARRAEQEGAR
jgi:chorismate-pyruvate lyase